MIKLKELLNEDTSNILDSTTTAEYIIQQQFEGYSWNDKIRNVDFEKAKNAYNGWMDVLSYYNKDKISIRLLKRTTVITDELIL